MNNYTEILSILSEAPETQIDPKICIRLKEMSNSVKAHSSEMKAILDECARYSLASDFAMVTMDMVWSQLIVNESRNEQN